MEFKCFNEITESVIHDASLYLPHTVDTKGGVPAGVLPDTAKSDAPILLLPQVPQG